MNRVYEHPNKKLHGTILVEGPCQSEIKWDNGTVRFCNNQNLREVINTSDIPETKKAWFAKAKLQVPSAFSKWKSKRHLANGKPNGKAKARQNGNGRNASRRSG